MKFNEVAQTFEQIEKESSRLEMTRLLAELFKKATPHEASIISNFSLGLLRAPYQGTQFNFAEKNVTKVVAHLLHESEAVIQAQAKKLGDLGSVVATGTWFVGQHLTVNHVYDALSSMEKISGTGSQEEKATALVNLLNSTDPLSGKYIVRIILGTLRLGFSDMTIVDALSWMETGTKSLRHILEDAYNVCADIGLIASTLKEKGKKRA